MLDSPAQRWHAERLADPERDESEMQSGTRVTKVLNKVRQQIIGIGAI